MFRVWPIVMTMSLALWPSAASADRDRDAAIGIEAGHTSVTITFPEPMRAIDNAPVRVVSIQPHRPLSCHWDDDIAVECLIEGNTLLPAATTIEVEIAPGLFTAEGTPIRAQRLAVETERPDLTAGITRWERGIPTIAVNANLPMTLEDATDALELRGGGRVWRDLRLTEMPTKYEVWERKAPRFALTLPSDVPADTTVELWLREGLVSTAGPLRGEKNKRILAFHYAEPFRVRGMGCAQRTGEEHDWNADDGLALDCVAGEPVRLYFSNTLSADARKTIETMLPAGVRVVGWGRGYEWFRRNRDVQTAVGDSVELQASPPLSALVFTLGNALSDEDGRWLSAQVSATLRNGLPRPSLRATASYLLVSEPKAARVLAVNAPPAGIVVNGLGQAAASEDIDSPASHQAMVTFTSPTTQRILSEGGWVQWRPSDGGAMHMSAPQFDLSAQIGPRHIVAWAVDWSDRRPIANAEVVLSMVGDIEGDGGETERVVARGRTDRDGLARLSVRSDIVLPQRKNGVLAPEWVLRADAQTRRAVLPLGNIYDFRLRFGRKDAAIRAFAVADRPLYRAGDTVRYRGWARTLRGGRLLAVGEGAIEFGLVSTKEEQALQTWTMTPDADGAFAGELALPVHLVDGDYCIRPIDKDTVENNGVCFFVGTFRAQDLWVEATATTPLLRPGGIFEATVSAGYWSGGGASGVGLKRVDAYVVPESPAEAYPQYADYRFAGLEPGDDQNSRSLRYGADQFPTLDAEGRTQIAVPVAFDDDAKEAGAPPPFARIEMTAEAGLAGREAVASNKAIARYAHFERYVGLRIQPSWFGANTPLRLQGVVIDAAGAAQTGAKIDITVDYVPASDGAETPSPVRVATCALLAGIETVCDVPRARSGRYRFTARSGDAAPAVLERDVWDAADARKRTNAPDPALTLIAAPATADAPMRVLLRQPYAQADALIVVSAGGELLDARVVPIARIESELTLSTFADGRNRVEIDVLVRSRDASTTDEKGIRTPPLTKRLSLSVDVPRRIDPAAIAIAFDAAHAAPGETRKIRVHNRSDQSRTVTLTVLDDALRSLAGARWNAFDPQGETWLGRRESSWTDALHHVGFNSWNSQPWRMNLPWEDAQRDIDRIALTQSRIPRSAQSEEAVPVLTLDRIALERSGLHSTGDVLFNISASDGVAASAPPRNSDDTFGFMGGNGEELDKIIVMGSRISRAAELAVGDAAVIGKPEPGVLRAEQHRRIAEARALFGARLRQRFDDTALWLPEIRLAPGETREIDVVVPDNLTRWRAVAWSADAGEDFEMVEATLEAGLPVEARLQAPVRVYPGDRATLVANVRHTGERATPAETILQVAALRAETIAEVALAPRGDGSTSLTIAPDDAAVSEHAMLNAVAAVRVGAHSDAVAQAIELASPTIAARKVQAGWLGASVLNLGAPTLPSGARDLQLSVSLLPGADALMHDWIGDLHRYPHRCWEQILSRAVAAAIALERGDGERFPDANAAIEEALSNVAVFQGERGDFRYFADSEQSAYDDNAAHTPLTAYSVRALRLLASLGHSVDATALRAADDYLQRRASDTDDDALALQRIAFAAAGQQKPERETTDRLWQRFDAQPLPVQVATARAMSNGDHPQAQQAVAKLLAATKRRGEARTLRATQRNDRWMSSDLREQCELIDVLRTHSAMTDATTRRALIAGLGDLYAGGYEDVDTQTGASCLIALRGVDADQNNAPVRMEIDRGDERTTLTLVPGAEAPTWSQAIDMRDAKRALMLDPEIVGDAPASYVVEYRYREDARIADSTAIGFALQRRYAVLRDGAWAPLENDRLRDGDWVRITLTIDSGRERYFVAITDEVPGGLRPTDLALSGVAGLDVQKVSDTGAYWFQTRRLDPRSPKFYAEYLPPGRHEVHYFARVGNAGDYLAAPAVAELMYGSATRARTAAERIVIAPASEQASTSERASNSAAPSN